MKTRIVICLMAAVVISLAGCNQNESDPPEVPTEEAAEAQTDAPDEMQIVVDDQEPADAPAAPAKASPSEPVAKVGDTIITHKEFDDNVARMSAQLPPDKVNLVRHAALDRMIEETVLLELAKQAGFTASDEEVQAQIQQAIAQLPEGVTFEQALQSQGITEDEVLESIQKGLILQQYIESYEDKVTIDEAALQADYDRFKAEGRLDNTDVAHILISSEGDPESDAAARQKIDEARQRIVEGGENFGAVASEVTDDPGSKARGGAYPGTPKGQMVPEFDAAMESTAIGEVSEPFKTEFGWHILTVTARNVVPIDDLRPSFTQRAVMEAVQAEVSEAREEMEIETLIELPPLSEEDAALLRSMRGEVDPDAPTDEAADAPVDTAIDATADAVGDAADAVTDAATDAAAAVEEAVTGDADEAAAQ